jgi:hypothetical protein
MTANLRTRCLAIALTALAGFACTSCNDKPDADANTKFGKINPAKTADLASDTPDIPKDARYTIFCRNFAEPTHVDDSREAQQLMSTNTPLKKWYVVHAADHSTLYYGFYRCMNPHDAKDGKEGQRAINDLNTIRAMQDSTGGRPFSESLVVGVDAPDPQANLDWDITRSKGMWSIEIACFNNSADRKERAVDAVREARSQGIEAYYYHGESASSVCIGSWPEEAVQERSMNSDDAPPLVVTNQPLPDEFNQQLARKGIKAVAPQVDILDPTLTQALEKWPEHSVNGLTLPGERAFLFKIPHPDPLDNMAVSGQAPVAAPLPEVPSQQPGVGHLPSLGE